MLALFLVAVSGWTVQGLPLISYSTDEGLGYGVRVQFVDHGSGEEQPFRYAINAQFYQTTKKIAAHQLSLDAPAFLGSRNRFQLNVAWAIYKFSPYYGLGNQSTYQPAVDTCADREALASDPDHCPGNPDFRGLRFYQYNQNTLPRVRFNVRRDLAGPWKIFAGYAFLLTRVSPLYSPDDLGQHDVSQMILDAQAGKLAGYDGSDPTREFSRRTSEITGGLLYDSRDNEPAPTEGMFHEVSLRSGLRAIGGQFDYGAVNTTLRFYHWLLDRRLVAAFRAMADAAWGDVPFFLLPNTGGLSGPTGIGGGDSVRGLLANRLQGKVKLLLNSELRWRFLSTAHVEVGAVGGLDAGRVWSELGHSEAGPMRVGASAGVRVAWNRDFVVRFDYGFGITEPYADGSIYLTFDEMF